MYPYLFTFMAFGCAGAICALIGDLKEKVYLGLASFLAVNAIIWAKFILALFSPADLFTAVSLFLLAHIAAASAYMGTVYFLDTQEAPGHTANQDALPVSRD